ncbi:RHS repeat-associated core domain-containing protein [Planctomycetota bacterium]
MKYYRARMYDPTIGRFTQKDPSGSPDGPNRYIYVSNNPVTVPIHF